MTYSFCALLNSKGVIPVFLLKEIIKSRHTVEA